MIKHIGEGLTPFEDCGFERTPETPLIGERVAVRCRLDGNGETPALRVRDASGERVLSGERERETPGSRYFAFQLGAFDACQTVSYQFVAGAETSPWYAFDVLRK